MSFPIVFDKETKEFVHSDGGRQKVYSNLVFYPKDNVRWNPNVIDPELKQQALEHCLGFSLGPRPSNGRTEVAPSEQIFPALPETGCRQSASISQHSNENTSLSCNVV